MAGAVPRGVAPGDVKQFLFPIDPLKPWVLAAVDLGHQPGLQPHAAGRKQGSGGWLVHGTGVCRREGGQGTSGGRAMARRALPPSQHRRPESLQPVQMLKSILLSNHQLFCHKIPASGLCV